MEKEKTLTVSKIFAWIFGVIFLLTGFANIIGNLLAGILFILASLFILPPAYSFIKNKTKLNLSKGLRILIAIILLVIAGSSLGNKAIDEVKNMTTDKKEDVTEKQETPKEEAISITSYELSKAYSDNGVSAEAKYEGKLVEVSGVITNIDKDITGEPFVSLKGTEYNLFGVQCMFGRGNDSDLIDLSKGQSVTLAGRVSGEMIGNVLVRGCTLVK